MDWITEASFAQQNFGAVELGDVRRTRRLVLAAEQLCRHPGGSLPDKLPEPAELHGLYHLLNRPEVTHAKVLAGHTAWTRQRIAECQGETVLCLHDATELDYTTRTKLRDRLGQIGAGTHRGYICHNSLAVRAASGETLGLTSQLLHHRADVPKNETDAQRRERVDRESRLWVQGAAASGPAPAGVRIVDVSDSLSDTFEYMAYEVTHDRHFVLQARENRRLDQPVGRQRYLFEAIRAAAPVASYEINVQAQAGRQARVALVKLAFVAVRIAPPLSRSGDYPDKPLSLWCVRVWEPKPPAGEEPLEWIVLSNVAVADAADARERISWYECRPIVEEYHKGMKTGCSIEGMQFDTIEALEPAIALLSITATTLLQLRDAARRPDAETRPATEVVASEYVEVLSQHYVARVKAPPTVRQFYLLVARLGGHQNRKSDGFPGWITLWRGWMKLQSMVDGYRAARRNARRCAKS